MAADECTVTALVAGSEVTVGALFAVNVATGVNVDPSGVTRLRDVAVSVRSPVVPVGRAPMNVQMAWVPLTVAEVVTPVMPTAVQLNAVTPSGLETGKGIVRTALRQLGSVREEHENDTVHDMFWPAFTDDAAGTTDTPNAAAAPAVPADHTTVDAPASSAAVITRDAKPRR
jgi:hypothetical protein